MSAVILHGPDCPMAMTKPGKMHVVVKELDSLAEEVYSLLEEHGLPFYSVEAHNSQCPGCHFPWEDLELRLFILQN